MRPAWCFNPQQVWLFTVLTAAMFFLGWSLDDLSFSFYHGGNGIFAALKSDP